MTPLETNTRIKKKLDYQKRQYEKLAAEVEINRNFNRSQYHSLETQLAESNKCINKEINFAKNCIIVILSLLIITLAIGALCLK